MTYIEVNGCKFYTTLTKMKTSKPLPDLEYLKQCFEIDNSIPQGLKWKSQRPESHFKTVGLHKKWTSEFAGKPCGCINGRNRRNKYYVVRLNKKHIFNHRIIYAIHNSVTDFNGKIIDHIDANSQNNDPRNLRLVTSSENQLNSRMPKNSKSGHKNISFHKRNKSYYCVIRIRGKDNWLGSFKTLEEALQARNSFMEKMKVEFGNYFRI